MIQRPSDGQIIAAFEDMLICHPRAEQAHEVFDTLREAKRRSPNTPKSWVALFAPSYSGKTRTVRLYMKKVVDQAIASRSFPTRTPRSEIEIAQKTVIYISVPSSNVTQKTLITMLLAKLGDPLPAKGNTGQQLQRVYELMEKLGTEILFFDEMQHLGAAMRDRSERRVGYVPTNGIAYLIKTLLDNGHVPIVCIGVTAGRSHLMANEEVANRCYESINFEPIKANSVEMLDVFATYCGLLSLELVRYELFPEISDFVSDEIPDCLLDVAGGKLGDATVLIRRACQFAARRGARCVEYMDLEAATDKALAGRGQNKLNLFRERRLAKGLSS